MEHTKISTDIEQNIKQFQQLFADSADIKMKEMRLGKGKRRRCFLAYIEVAVSNMLLETTALGRLLAALSELPEYKFLIGYFSSMKDKTSSIGNTRPKT